MSYQSPQKPHKMRNILLIALGIFIIMTTTGGLIAYFSTQSTSKVADEFVEALVSGDE